LLDALVATMQDNYKRPSTPQDVQIGLAHGLMATPCPTAIKMLVYGQLGHQVLQAHSIALKIGEALIQWLHMMVERMTFSSSASSSSSDASLSSPPTPVKQPSRTPEARIETMRKAAAWFHDVCVPADLRQTFEQQVIKHKINDSTLCGGLTDRTQALLAAIMVTPCPISIQGLIAGLLLRDATCVEEVGLVLGEAYTDWLHEMLVYGKAKRVRREQAQLQGDGHLEGDALLARMREATGESNLKLTGHVTYLCDVVGCGATFQEAGHLDGFECRACVRRYDTCKGDVHAEHDARTTCPLCKSKETRAL
jgi:hypothetical protein